MGHLVNPLSFRLGVNYLWKYIFFVNGKIEHSYLLIQQLNLQTFIKKFFNLRIFPKRGYLFSHINLLYFSKWIDCRIYIYKTINNINFKIFHFQKLTKILTKLSYKIMFFQVIYKLRLFFNYYFFVLFFSFFNFKYKIFLLKNFKLKKNLSLILLYILIKRNRFYNFFSIINYFIFLRYNFSFKKITSNKFSNIIKKKKKKKHSLLILKLFFWFLKFRFWKKISFFFLFFFKKFIESFVILRFCKINYLGVNIKIIGNYIVRRLKQRFKVVELMMPIIRSLKKNKTLLGFKFSFCGRFSRKEMATTEFFCNAAVPFNTIGFFIDYSLVGVILKDSYCGIKIWLNRRKDRFLDQFFHNQNLIWKIIK